MNVATALRQAEAWAQGELGNQLRLLEAMEAHEKALGTGAPEAIVETLEALDAQLAGDAGRARERRRWTEALGRAWGIEPRTLTLGSVVERAGADGARLARTRAELERALAQVSAAGRRIAMIARTQRSVVSELIQTLTGADPECPEHSRGTLVNAEA